MGYKKDKKSLKYLNDLFGSQVTFKECKKFKEKYGTKKLSKALKEA